MISFFLFLTYLYLINLWFKSHKSILILPLLIGGVIIIFYRLELSLLDMDVYFSDALYYYERSFESFSNLKIFEYAFYLKIINLFSIVYFPLEINIVNFLIFQISCLLMLKLILISTKFNIEAKNKIIYRSSLFIFCNPFLIISLIRNVKDVSFLFLIISFIYLIIKFDKIYIKIILTLLFSYVLLPIRPWSVILTFSILFYDIFLRIKTSKGLLSRSILLVCAVSLILIIPIYFIDNIDTLLKWYEIAERGGITDTFDLSFKSRIIGPLKLLFSPGIPRLLNPSKYFTYHTITLIISLFIGIFLNYCLLTRLIDFKRIMISIKNNFHIFLISLIGIVIYSFSYAGSVEFRIKATILSPLFFIIIASIPQNKFIINNSNIIILFMILFLSSIISI